MPPLREWSFARVVLAGVLWVVGLVLCVVLWLFWYFRPTFESGGGSAGIGAVSIGITALWLAIPVLPPLALFTTWLILRWRR
jgi:hypothetical protein